MLTDIEIKNARYKHCVHQEFNLLLEKNSPNDIKNFISNRLSLELITLNDGYLYKMDNNSILSLLVEHNDINIIDYVINLPKFKNDFKYDELLVNFIETGFMRACEKNDFNMMAYFEKLQKEEFVDCGLQAMTLEKTSKGIIKNYHYLSRCLEKIVDNNSDDTTGLEFILSLKNKYKSEECNFGINSFIGTCENGQLKKADLIYEIISTEPSFLNELLKNARPINNQPNPAISYVIFDKNMEYTDTVKNIVQDYPEAQKLFLMRDLDEKLKEKVINSPKMKI